MINIRYSKCIAAFFLGCFLAGCNETASTTGSSKSSDTLESLAKNASSRIIYEDGWAIVSKVDNTGRVYWFFAPDIDDVSPAMFKKTILYKDEKKEAFEVVSRCDAPKQVCDDLMKQFEILSEEYQ